MKKNIFINNNVIQQLDEKGSAVIDFCDDGTIEKLKELFNQFLPQINHMPVIITLLHEKRSVTKAIHNEIVKILTPDINRYFTDYKIPIALFFAKKPSAEVEVGLHQDPMITDQATTPSYGIWLPLVETNVNNGTLAVLDKSHRWFHPFQADTVPSSIDNISEQLVDDCTTFHLKPGQAVIMDNRLVHYSYPNISNELRPAVVIKLTPKSAECVTLYKQDKDIYLIKNNEDFYLNETWIYDKSEFPQGEVLGVLDFIPQKVNFSEYLDIKNKNMLNYYQSKPIKHFLKQNTQNQSINHKEP